MRNKFKNKYVFYLSNNFKIFTNFIPCNNISQNTKE